MLTISIVVLLVVALPVIVYLIIELDQRQRFQRVSLIFNSEIISRVCGNKYDCLVIVFHHNSQPDKSTVYIFDNVGRNILNFDTTNSNIDQKIGPILSDLETKNIRIGIVHYANQKFGIIQVRRKNEQSKLSQERLVSNKSLCP